MNIRQARKLLLEGARTDDIASLRAALATGANNKDEALYDACQLGKAEAVLYLIQCKANVNYQDRDWPNHRPLTIACAESYAKIIGLLLEAGADPSLSDTEGHSPLHEAAMNCDEYIIYQLCAAGAKVSATDGGGYTPLHCAALRGYIKTMDRLLLEGAEISAKNNSGYTPLHYASLHGDTKTVDYLLTKNADVLSTTNYGSTPLSLARSRSHINTIRRLEKAEHAARQKQALETKRALEAQSRGQGG